MRSKNLDLILITAIVLMNVIWTQIPIAYRFTAVGVVLALPLILFLSGYALTQTLFRKREVKTGPAVVGEPGRSANWKIGHPIGEMDQMVLSLGLSLAIDVLVGFLLNLLPIGLEGLSWIFSLSFLTLIFVVMATILRRKDASLTSGALKVRLTFQDYALFGLAFLIISSAVWLSVIRPLQPQPSFTQFWMLPANQVDKTCAVSLGIQSYETSAQTFNVVLMINNTQTNAWSSIDLIPQQKWDQSVVVTPGTTNSLYIEARLYKVNQPDSIYRDVHLTFYISSINTNGSVQKRCVYGTQN